MKANELRIGNLIYNGIGEIISVNSYTISYFEIGEATLGKFKSIPLTEEWLLKFGFHESPLDEIIIFRNGKFSLSRNAKHHYSVGYNGGFMRFVQYVHQLQNLYFALTGNELAIK